MKNAGRILLMVWAILWLMKTSYHVGQAVILKETMTALNKIMEDPRFEEFRGGLN